MRQKDTIKHIIRNTTREDREHFLSILKGFEHFTEEEKDCAIELLDIYLEEPSEYLWLTALVEGQPVGFACYGEAALSDGAYDIYWIMVEPSRQHRGIGKDLMEKVEEETLKAGGRKLIIETSSLPQYAGARRFYRDCGFTEEARIREYYRPGDHKLVYTKTLRR